MAHRPVGAGSSFNFSSGAASTSSPFYAQSSVLRLVSVGAASHVKIDGNPSASISDYYIPSGGTATLGITKASNRVVGVVTGSSTVITVPEGTQVPFGVGDFITLSNSTYHNFTHAEVLSVDTTSSFDGYYQTRMTVDHDSSGIITSFSDPNAFVSNSLKVSALGTSSGTLYYQQVQISGDA
jgi:hypothetical protein